MISILDYLASFSLVIEMGAVSLMLFGEYEYPKESDFE